MTSSDGRAGDSSRRKPGARESGAQGPPSPRSGDEFAASHSTSSAEVKPTGEYDPEQLRAALQIELPEFATTRALTARDVLLEIEQLLGQPIVIADDARTRAALSTKVHLHKRAVTVQEVLRETCRKAGLTVSFEPCVTVRAADPDPATRPATDAAPPLPAAAAQRPIEHIGAPRKDNGS
ncbi:MAG: hypothetical protein D6725_07950 [Planctomycetota bacterium]|nr:MAG: hypothetical protein D6725_07950 [Planctomycetota bacterium]